MYDPLGFVPPVILHAKSLLQSFCNQKYGWDEEISEEDYVTWRGWLRELNSLRTFSVPTILAKNNGMICKINHELSPRPPAPKQCCYDAEFIYSPNDSSCAQHCLGGRGAFQKLQRQLNKNVKDRLKVWKMKMFTDNGILCSSPGNFWPGLSEKVVLQKTHYIFRKDKYYMRFIACT